MFSTLLEDPDVKRAATALERSETDNPTRTRRRLLSSAVRLTRRMAPDVYRSSDECVEKLGSALSPELYVYPSPMFNAGCFKPEDGNLLVMVTSSLLSSLEDRELTFVIGHELGHYIYQHHDLPVGYILRGFVHPEARLALDLFAWSRYAEISADRAGAYCAHDIEAVVWSLFKLASGLTGDVVRFDLEDFLSQVTHLRAEDESPDNSAPREDWFSTHPFSPLRVQAITHFRDSELYDPGGMSTDDLELSVQGLMSLMEPNYLEGKSNIAEAMRRLLFAGALTVANADGVVTPEEIQVFERFFGKRAFSDSLNLDQLAAEIESRAAQVRSVASTPQAMQVMRDLCIVARAEGHTQPAELRVLHDVAHWLEISRSFVDQTLEAEFDPD